MASVAFSMLMGSQAAARGSTPEAAFANLERAWKAQDAEGFVKCMPAKGRLRLRLYVRPFKRSQVLNMHRDQALASLKAYFKGIDTLTLTMRKPPARVPGRPAPPKNVRTYDYKYRVKGANTQTTRILVSVAKDRDGKWAVASIMESAAPRR